MKLGIISDIHEDILRLQEAMGVFEKKKCDQLICLGDIVGFNVDHFTFLNSRNANECICLIKDNFSIATIGNHDLFAIKKTPIHTGGFNYPETWYDLDFEQRTKLAKGRLWLYEDRELSALLNVKSIEFLAQLPEYKVFETEDMRILFSHYMYPDFTGSLVDFRKENNDFKPHLDFLHQNEIDLSFIGHVHPHGMQLIKNLKLKTKEFGKYKIKKSNQTYICPAIASGASASGLIIFDTDSLIVEAVPLKSKKLKT